MGTRADFYIGRGEQAQWLGSVAMDGYEWEGEGSALMKATTPEEFRAAVAAIQDDREDFTSPAEGWPWPWDDSRTTDYAYVLHEGKTTAFCFGREVLPKNGDDEDDAPQADKVDWFPNMSAIKKVQWGRKSGVIVIIG